MTDLMLAQLTLQVVDSFPGPAFVAGDFNQEPGVLHETAKWEAKGWMDIQTWACEHFGIQPSPTCQRTTRKDYVYLSPSLQKLMLSCSNTFDKFPDHSTLMGVLTSPGKPPSIARWPKPQPIEYNDLAPKLIASIPGTCN